MTSERRIDQVPFKTISFSAIESFLKCPQLFKEKYILNTDYEKPLNKHLLIGGWTHSLIEAKIKDGTQAAEALKMFLPAWLDELGIHFEDEEDNEDLYLTVIHLSDYLYRASAMCCDPQRMLRTKNNTLIKDPTTFPTAELKKELYNSPYIGIKGKLDYQAAAQRYEFVKLSLCWLLADAFFMAHTFRVPSWISRTIGVELGFGVSEDTAVVVENTGYSLLGFIDWVVELEDGRIAIFDHKTSKSKPTATEVKWHPQLNLYAYAYEIIFRQPVSIIGINHLRSGEVIASEIDTSIQSEVIEHFIDVLHQAITGSNHYKHRPIDFNSPCLKKDYITGEIVETCPFLNKCWTSFCAELNLDNQ